MTNQDIWGWEALMKKWVKKTLSCTPGSKTVGWFLKSTPGEKKFWGPISRDCDVVKVLT